MNERTEIARLHEAHWTERQIARFLELSPATVHYWLSERGEPKKRGRPRKTDATVDAAIVDLSRQKPFHMARELKGELQLNVSHQTIRRRLREKGQKCYVPARKPFLNAQHLYQRLYFASSYLTWTTAEWNNVIFSDEKIFRSFSHGPLHVWRPTTSDRYDPRYVAQGVRGRKHKIALWMGFGLEGNFKKLVLIEQETLNSEYYCRHILPLVKKAMTNPNYIFQQDLSPIHMSGRTKNWLENNCVDWMELWPPKAGDLNPVENVWAELVRRVRIDTKNKYELWEEVLAAFDSLQPVYFEKLVATMEKRIKRVATTGGSWCKY